MGHLSESTGGLWAKAAKPEKSWFMATIEDSFGGSAGPRQCVLDMEIQQCLDMIYKNSLKIQWNPSLLQKIRTGEQGLGVERGKGNTVKALASGDGSYIAGQVSWQPESVSGGQHRTI